MEPILHCVFMQVQKLCCPADIGLGVEEIDCQGCQQIFLYGGIGMEQRLKGSGDLPDHGFTPGDSLGTVGGKTQLCLGEKGAGRVEGTGIFEMILIE